MKTKSIKTKAWTAFLSLCFMAGFSQTLPNNLQACYSLDGTAADGTANSLNGTINGNVTSATGHLGLSGTGMQFGGTATDYIALPNNSLIKPTNALTMSGWFNVSTSSPLQVLIYANNTCNSNFDAFSLVWDGPSQVFRGFKRPGQSTCGAGVSVSSAVMTSGWHHVVWYIDNNVLQMVVDNGAMSSTAHSVLFNYNPASGIILGGTGLSINAPFNGRMDNVRFWNRQLTAGEITTLYTNDPLCSSCCPAPVANQMPAILVPPTPVAQWEFNNNLNDGVGVNNGTWENTGGPAPANSFITDRCGNPNKAIHLNGTTNYIRCGNPPASVQGNNARSLSFWMRTGNTSVGGPGFVRSVFNYGIFNGNPVNNPNANPPINQPTAGSRWEICHNYSCAGMGIDVSQHYVTYSNTCVNNGMWHHVVVTQAQGAVLNAADIYLDGVLIPNPWTTGCGNINMTSPNPAVNATMNQLITIGAILSAGPTSAPIRYFNGDLDDIYLYDRVLAPNEVNDLFSRNCQAPPVTICGPTDVCQGKTYTYSTCTGLASYNWVFPAGWQIISGANTNVVTVQAGTNSGSILFTIGSANCGGTSASLAVNSVDCCRIPPPGITNISTSGSISGPYVNSNYAITKDVTLNQNVTFKDADFAIAPNVKIIVPSGKILTIEHSHLYSCKDSLWKGIVVQNGGQVISLNQRKGSTLIEDALEAIEIDAATTGHATPIVDLHEVIFNKNYIGIEVSNSAGALTTIPLSINSCVFTSRNLPYSVTLPFTNTSWPSADATGGLRTANNSFNVLAAPCNLTGAISLIKQPFASQPGHIGIRAFKIYNVNGVASTPGLDIGMTYQTSNGSYNLFDGIGRGFDVEDASLSTMNNVFQNMQIYNVGANLFGGTAIHHVVTNLMNARLDLQPAGLGNQTTSMGNRFYNCLTSVRTKDVYEVGITYGTFRSTRNFGTNYGVGSRGIFLESNRFTYNIEKCEFNNLDTAIVSHVNSGTYDVNSNFVAMGTYADNVNITQNYFGPQVASNITLLPGIEHLDYAISLNGQNASNWQNVGNCTIFSNKIDRAFHGISIDQMADYPIHVGGDTIRIVDDMMWGSNQYGIYANASQGNLEINQNNLTGSGISNQNLILVHSINNVGSGSPIVTRNKVFNAFVGFEFDGPQPNTNWTCNYIYEPVSFGLSLVNNGVIGQQGSLSPASGNRWFFSNVLNPGNVYTRCINSNPALSPLYVEISSWAVAPFHTGTPWPWIYSPATFITSFPGGGAGNDCLLSAMYPTLPSQRTAQIQTGVDEKTNIYNNWNLTVYPNPSSGKITLSSPLESETIQITISDVTGKVVFSGSVTTVNHEYNMELSGDQSIYFMEVKNSNGVTSHKKIVINK